MQSSPVGKNAEKVVCRKVLLTIWHCNLSAELTQNALLQTVFFGNFAHCEKSRWNYIIQSVRKYQKQYPFLYLLTSRRIIYAMTYKTSLVRSYIYSSNL